MARDRRSLVRHSNGTILYGNKSSSVEQGESFYGPLRRRSCGVMRLHRVVCLAVPHQQKPFPNAR
jgi:hypothetical protein